MDESDLAGPEFVERLRARDAEALTALVQAYEEQLYRAGLGMGLDPPASKDVVQSVFLTFLESLDRFEGRSTPRTWLFGILLNKVREHRRARSHNQQHETIDSVVDSRFDSRGRWVRPPKDIEKSLAESEFRVSLKECLDRLPSIQRAAFHLREIEQMSTEDICKILEISITHFGVTLYRARHRLRECLESKGIGRHAL